MSAAADQGHLLNRVSMATYTIAVVFVLLRFFTRGFVVKKFGLDDLFIFIAITLGLAQTATNMLQVEHGRGRHAIDLHLEDFNLMLMFNWIDVLVYVVANWAVKMSILALYHRIGAGKRGLPLIVQARAIWITGGFISAFTLAVIVVQIFTCVPVNGAWDIERVPLMCIDTASFMHAQGAINVFTDVLLLLYPLPLLPLLKFNKPQRTAVIVIFSVGLIPVVASTMRFCEIVMSGNGLQRGMGWKQADSSWKWAWVPVWSQIEVDTGIVTACLPCFSPLLRLVWSEVKVSRTTTPSMVELPKYSGSWATTDSQDSIDTKKPRRCCKRKGSESDNKVAETKLPERPEDVDEKNEQVITKSYYDDASDEEEAREVGVATTSDKRVELNRKLS